MPIIAVAQTLQANDNATWRPLVLLGSQTAFPFRARPSTILVNALPPDVIAAEPALEQAGIPSRLATLSESPGCYDGKVIELAAIWLRSLNPQTLKEVEMIVCGEVALLTATLAIARQFAIGWQQIELQAASQI